ncbi:MAG: hypothetical protein ACRDQF_17810, partial [Thermocrispum sp.]
MPTSQRGTPVQPAIPHRHRHNQDLDIKRVQAQLGVLAPISDDVGDPLGRIGADQGDLGAAFLT